MSKIEFENAVVPEDTIIKSILDYRIHFKALRPEDTHYMAIGMNYSTAGFEIILSRKMSFYIITYYLPSGLFVVVSWISFLIPPDIVPGIYIDILLNTLTCPCPCSTKFKPFHESFLLIV